MPTITWFPNTCPQSPSICQEMIRLPRMYTLHMPNDCRQRFTWHYSHNSYAQGCQKKQPHTTTPYNAFFWPRYSAYPIVRDPTAHGMGHVAWQGHCARVRTAALIFRAKSQTTKSSFRGLHQFHLLKVHESLCAAPSHTLYSVDIILRVSVFRTSSTFGESLTLLTYLVSLFFCSNCRCTHVAACRCSLAVCAPLAAPPLTLSRKLQQALYTQIIVSAASPSPISPFFFSTHGTMIPTPVYTTEAHPIGVWQAWYSDNLAAIEDSSKYVFYGPNGHNDGSNDLQQIAVPFYPEWAGPVEGSNGNGSNGGRNGSGTNGGKGSSNNSSASHDIATVAIPTQPRTPRDTCPKTQTSANMRVYSPYEYTDSLNKRVCWTPYFLGTERQEFDSHLRMFMNYCRWANMRLRPAPQAERGDVKAEVVVTTQAAGCMLSPGTKRPRNNGMLDSISEAHDRANATTPTSNDRPGATAASSSPHGRGMPNAKRPSYGSVPSYVTAGAPNYVATSSTPSYTATAVNSTYAPTTTTSTSSGATNSPYTFQQSQQSYLPPPQPPTSKSTTSLSPSISSGSPNNQSLTSVSSISSPVTSPYQTPQTRPLVPEAAHAAQAGQPPSTQQFYSAYQNYYNLSPQNEFQPFEGD